MSRAIWTLAAVGAAASVATAASAIELAGGPGAKPPPAAAAKPAPAPVPVGTAPLSQPVQSQSALSQPALAAAAAAGTPIGFDGVVCPPDSVAALSRPGQCFAQVVIAPLVQSYSEQAVAPPARVETVETPAAYHTIVGWVAAPSGSARQETVPAQYDTVSEQQLVTPPRMEWRRISTYPSAAYPDGVVYQLIQTAPAEYRTVQRQVLRSPARVVAAGPAMRETTIQVIDRPAYTSERAVPAAYAPQTRERVLQPGGVEWREVLCERNASPQVIRRAQVVLNAWGYDAGTPDGTLNPRTRAAIVRFQHAQRLAEGAFTVETARMLGVLPPSSPG